MHDMHDERACWIEKAQQNIPNTTMDDMEVQPSSIGETHRQTSQLLVEVLYQRARKTYIAYTGSLKRSLHGTGFFHASDHLSNPKRRR